MASSKVHMPISIVGHPHTKKPQLWQNISLMGFQQDFVWGVSTASYQIEGGQCDGRGDSVWDMMCRKPGAVFQGHNGTVACDHYHRYQEDVDLLKQLGVQGYRLSLCWPRMLPSGTGKVNQKGLDFYDRLIDALLAAGVDPWVTLFHWDYPTDLYHRGGWLSPDSPKWFADYAQIVADRFGDRVTNWFTQNEPQCYIGLGLWDGIHAPGDKLGWQQILLAAKHSMLGHGLAVQALRTASKPGKIGMAPVGQPFAPASNSPADIEAARELTFKSSDRSPWQNTLWMDPVLKGVFPQDILDHFPNEAPEITAEDLKTMNQPVDFFGVNTYNAEVVKAGPNGPELVARAPGHPQTAIRWWVQDNAVEWAARFFYERYGLPIVVTENGMANNDWVALDGKVHDPQRIDFLHRSLRGLKRAADDGIPIHGYFQWSLMDNFEWAEGYSQRFGLVHVDYETLKRTPKDSYYWYQDVIKSNADNL